MSPRWALAILCPALLAGCTEAVATFVLPTVEAAPARTAQPAVRDSATAAPVAAATEPAPAPSGERMRTLEGHTFYVTGVAWSPDGTRLASGSWDHTIILWDMTP